MIPIELIPIIPNGHKLSMRKHRCLSKHAVLPTCPKCSVLIRFLCSARIPWPTLGLWKRSSTVVGTKKQFQFDMTLLLLLAVEQGNPLSCVLVLNSVSLHMKLMMWLFGYTVCYCSQMIWLNKISILWPFFHIYKKTEKWIRFDEWRNEEQVIGKFS